jgi:hypothetical protein
MTGITTRYGVPPEDLANLVRAVSQGASDAAMSLARPAVEKACRETAVAILDAERAAMADGAEWAVQRVTLDDTGTVSIEASGDRHCFPSEAAARSWLQGVAWADEVSPQPDRRYDLLMRAPWRLVESFPYPYTGPWEQRPGRKASRG